MSTSPPVSVRSLLAILGGFIFLAVGTSTMVNVALPSVGAEFRAPESTYGWVLSGYMLTFGVFSSVYGRLADRFGLRRMYLFGVLCFSGFALVNAAAPDVHVLIASRTLQGAGATALPALGTALVARLVPEERRGASMGVLASVMGVAASVGPFLGGLLVQLGSWRWVFLLPGFGLLLIPPFLRVIPAAMDDSSDETPFDVVGAALLTVGASALLVSTSALKAHGPASPVTAGCVLGGVVTLLAFLGWIRRAAAPFIPPSLLGNVPFLAAAGVASLANVSRFGTLVLVPIFLSRVDGLDPVWIGAVLLPGALAMTVAAPVAGRMADRGRVREVATGGAAIMALGCVVTAACAGGTPVGTALGMALFGLGFAGIQSPTLAFASRVLPASQVGAGNGLFMTIYFLGGAFGAALAVTGVSALPADAPAWLRSPLLADGAGRFSNVVLAQGLATLAVLALVPLLKAPAATPRARAAVADATT